jgi:hypothetical protein
MYCNAIHIISVRMAAPGAATTASSPSQPTTTPPLLTRHWYNEARRRRRGCSLKSGSDCDARLSCASFSCRVLDSNECTSVPFAETSSVNSVVLKKRRKLSVGTDIGLMKSSRARCEQPATLHEVKQFALCRVTDFSVASPRGQRQCLTEYVACALEVLKGSVTTGGTDLVVPQPRDVGR